jgi:hypothetical protein
MPMLVKVGVGFKSTYELIGKKILGEEIFQAKA